MNPTYAAALKRLEAKAEKHVMAQALDYQGEWIDVLSQPGQGEQYGPHRASAPGDPPAADSGLLRGAVQAHPLRPLTWGVGVVSAPYPGGKITTAEVARHLEYGTRTILPRPHARPALERYKAKRLGKP